MKADDLRKLHGSVPFQPFSLILADGRSFHVPHPDFFSIAPKGTALVLWGDDGGIGSYLDPALIAEVRMDANGGSKSAKRRR